VQIPLRHPSIVHLSSSPAAIAPPQPGRSGLVIAGLAIAALLFFAVAAGPARIRFASTGRIVLYHQAKLFAAGVAALLLTFVFFVVAQT
jgi:hypothetical protein